LVTKVGEEMQYILKDVAIGENVKNLRVAQNLTQSQLVEKIQLMGSSMSRETLAQIESGRRNIKASDFKVLKEALNTTYDELLKEQQL
jgi:transcriptional regulator with XRE-family HTH domain